MGSRRRAVGSKRRSAAGDGSAAPRAKAGGKPGPGRFPEVEELVELMDRHGLLEVDYHTAPDGSRRIRVARAGAGGHGLHVPAALHNPRSAEAGHGTAPAGSHAAPGATAPPGEKLHAFNSPMVGTFYRAPSPEAPPFVSVGDKVDEHRTVCIIEAMKVMNEITPDMTGEVVSIEVENGEAVEYGQTLFLIRPA